MGVVNNISSLEFPKQSKWVNKKVNVCFHFDTTITIRGVIVRYDIEHPGRIIIKLDDGRHILDVECQFSII